MLSRPSETVWTSRQIFRFCAWLLSSLFGAPTSWIDRTLNHMAAALTIRPLLTRLADVLEGRAGDCRGEAHLVASASTAVGSTPKPGRSSSCPGGMDTSRCSGRVTIACRAIHFAGNVPSPLTASPAETSSRERRSWRGRGVAAVLAGVVIAWAWSEGSTRVRLWVPADSRGPGGSISARVPGNRAEQALS